jgi:GDP-L-fucose synthase
MSDIVRPNARIFVTGHRGLVGSAIVRALQSRGCNCLLTATRDELDLRDPGAVDRWFAEHRPEAVIHVAGKVGGIHANATEPADFLYDNLMIHATVMRSAWEYGVEKLLYLGSSCIYPRDCPQPIREEYMLSGPLESTNEAYAIAKIAGVVACGAYRRQHGSRFISAMPTNLYGPGDNFDLKSSHLLPALIRKFHEAKIVDAGEAVVWGTGRVRRELMHVDDLADACLFLLDRYDDEQTINVGTGEDATIAEIADLVRAVVYPEAKTRYDASMPDGTPRKLLDVSRLHALGWKHRVNLADGVASTYQWYLENQQESARAAAKQKQT